MKKHLFSGIAEVSIALTKTFPAWIRPLAIVGIYCFTVISTLAALPFVPFIIMAGKRSYKSYWRLREDLEKIWYRQSSYDALLELRTIHQQLDCFSCDPKSVKPYGRFSLIECYKLTVLLYHWEIYHGNWEEAINLCDQTLDPLPGLKRKLNLKSWKEWIICKAACIEKLEGKVKARAFLLQHIDLKDEQCAVRKYFDKLRSH